MHSNEPLHLWRRIDNSCFWSASEAKVRGDFQEHNSNHKPAAFLFFFIVAVVADARANYHTQLSNYK